MNRKTKVQKLSLISKENGIKNIKSCKIRNNIVILWSEVKNVNFSNDNYNKLRGNQLPAALKDKNINNKHLFAYETLSVF